MKESDPWSSIGEKKGKSLRQSRCGLQDLQVAAAQCELNLLKKTLNSFALSRWPTGCLSVTLNLVISPIPLYTSLVLFCWSGFPVSFCRCPFIPPCATLPQFFLDPRPEGSLLIAFLYKVYISRSPLSLVGQCASINHKTTSVGRQVFVILIKCNL